MCIQVQKEEFGKTNIRIIWFEDEFGARNTFTIRAYDDCVEVVGYEGQFTLPIDVVDAFIKQLKLAEKDTKAMQESREESDG